MARPKKVPDFDYDKPAASVIMDNAKFLAQGDNLFSYAEAQGKWVEGKGRKLTPPPVFIMTSKEWDLKQKKEKHLKLKLETYSKSTALSELEKELKAEGLLDDTS